MRENDADVSSSVCRTFSDLLVQRLQEDVLIYVLYMDEVGVVGVYCLLEFLKLLYRDTQRSCSETTWMLNETHHRSFQKN